MTHPRDDFPDLGSALEMFEQEQAKLAEFQRRLAETSTVVESRNHLLTVTLDGNGELSELKFNTTAYRSMAPAELASVITETLQKARAQSLRTMQELMGGPVAGLDINEIATGEADLAAVLGKVMEPSLRLVQEAGGPPAPRRAERDDSENDGWER
ncbi:YbaB/EbfC family nucleoid-associated protein [Saccharopolyspora sp. 5N708]|uniref:YbaB/EbfC family nucleoid-associated protein n=1 Tax=Saccharopolyspora sp. 5N708 TaxID=3457424 RepID=UPI003FD25592